MKTLDFCKKSARELYLEYYPWLKFDERRLTLLILRSEFLWKNHLFVKEWNELDKLKSSGNTETAKEKARSLLERWYVNTHGLTPPFGGPETVIKEKGLDLEKATITLEIDLKFPKTKVLNEVKFYINKWYDDFWTKYKQETFKWWCYEKGEDPAYMTETDWEDWQFDWKLIKEGHGPERILGGNQPKDLKDYERYIEVWRMKNEKNFSWSKIKTELNLHSIENARYWYEAAKKLIKRGVPGFPYFPLW